MKITSYIHPTRTYLPCTGAGRYINNTVLGISARPEIELDLLFSEQWLESDNKLPQDCPLRDLPMHTFSMSENATERTWKLLKWPCMDSYISSETDWLFAPMETYIPVSRCPVALTILDIQAFETDLPWSQTWHHRLFRYKWSQWIYRALAEYRVIFTISEFSKQRMVELLGAKPERIIVTGVGIEQPFFEIASVAPETIKKPVDASYVLVIGGLRYKKGADYVMSIANQLYKKKSLLQIVIAGESEKSYCKTAIDHPNIFLIGKVADNDLPTLLRGASSLLFLSYYEGFGIPAVEAMAAGVPAVVSNRASLPEVVGDAGIVIDPEKTSEVTDILIQLATNPHLHAEWEHRGRIHANQYTWAKCVDRIVEAFREFA